MRKTLRLWDVWDLPRLETTLQFRRHSLHGAEFHWESSGKCFKKIQHSKVTRGCTKVILLILFHEFDVDSSFFGRWGPMRFFLCSLVARCFAEVLLSIKYFWPRHRSKLSMGQKSGCPRKGSKVLSVDRIWCFMRSKGLGKEHSTNDHYWTNSVLFTLEQFVFRGVCSRIFPIVIVQKLQRMGSHSFL